MKKLHECRAFTLIELLVVIAIISILVATMLPTITASRETARQKQCEQRMIELARVCQDYEMAEGHLPMGVNDPGDVIRNEPQGLHQSWVIPLLSYLGQPLAAEKLNREDSVYAPSNAEIRALTIRQLLCPSGNALNDDIGHSHYAGVYHHLEAPIAANNQGLLFLRSEIRSSEIRDGQGYTLLFGEKVLVPEDLGWISGTRATLRNTGTPPNSEAVDGYVNSVQLVDPSDREPPAEAAESEATSPTADEPAADNDAFVLAVGGFGSGHPGGVLFVFADGNTTFISNGIDPVLYRQLGSRDDGSLIRLDDLD